MGVEEIVESATQLWKKKETKFLFSTVMIFVCYLVFAALQEQLANKEWGVQRERFSFTLFMLLLQSVANCLVAYIIIKVEKVPPSTVPSKQCFMIALFYILAMFFSNAALIYISFPVQTLLKSCKPIPVMIVGSLLLGKRYSLSHYLCVIVMSIGIVMFVLSTPPVVPSSVQTVSSLKIEGGPLHSTTDNQLLLKDNATKRQLHQLQKIIESGTSLDVIRHAESLQLDEDEELDQGLARDGMERDFVEPTWWWWWGILMVLFSLAMDGLTGPFQEQQIKNYRPLHASQLMYLSNLWSIVIVCIGMIFTGEYIPAISMVIRFPAIALDLLWWSLCSALGQHFIYYHLFLFGALSISIVTTIRKFVTILGSVMIFGHRVSPIQWLGVSLVFLGLGMEVSLSHSEHSAKPVLPPPHQRPSKSTSSSHSNFPPSPEYAETQMTIGVSSAMLSVGDRSNGDNESFV